MQNEMAQMGEVFLKRRESKGITLKEVENATSIRLGYLEAIEKGHLGKLISPVYAQGFIKKYATFLEIDGDELIRQFPYVSQILNERMQQPPMEDYSFGVGSLEVRGTPGREVKWLPNMLWVALSVGVILTTWFIARYIGLF